MRIDLNEWRKSNFKEKLREYLTTLAEAAKNPENKAATRSIMLIKSTEYSEDSLDPIRALNALIGRLGRVIELDAELGLAEACFTDINSLTLCGFTLSDFKDFIPFFSKQNYPFITHLVLDCPSKSAQIFTSIEIKQLARSPILSISLLLKSDLEADQDSFKKFALELSAINEMKVSLVINSIWLNVNNIPSGIKKITRNTSTKAKKNLFAKRSPEKDVSRLAEQVTFHRENWMMSYCDLISVTRESKRDFLITPPAHNYLKLLFETFHYYGKTQPEALTLENPQLEKLYEALFPNNSSKSSALIALKIFFTSIHGFVTDEDLIALGAANFFYKEFILCGQAELPTKAETLSAWHGMLCHDRKLGHILCKETLGEFKTQTDAFLKILQLAEARALLKEDAQFNELLLQINNLYCSRESDFSKAQKDICHALQLVIEFYIHFGKEKTCQVVLQCCLGEQNQAHCLPQLLSIGLQLRTETSLSEASKTVQKNLFQRFLQLISEQKLDAVHWPIIKAALDDLIAEFAHNRFPARPLNEVVQDFIKNADVLDRLDVNELMHYYRICQQIDAYAAEFFVASDEQLKKIIAEFKTSKKEDKSLTDPKILGALREIIKRLYGIFPYNLQMINALALLNAENGKRLAQIKSGEGKSTLITLVTGMLTLHGRTVDIITTNEDLAERDAKKYKRFFQFIGSDSNHINIENLTIAQFNFQVIYGSINQFRHVFLDRKTCELPIQRDFDTAFVDEVDSMCIDTNDSPTILAMGARFPVEIYRMVWSFVRSLASKDINEKELSAFLKANKVTEITDDDIKMLINGAKQALDAREGIDYVIEKNRVVVVDHLHTGALHYNTRWSNGCHSFLEIEHNLEVEPDRFQIASINNYQYFNLYSHLLGVTGTLGSKSTREDLRFLYGINLYDSPRYLPSKKQTLPPILSRNQKQQFADIIRVTLEYVAAGRPVLIITPTVKTSIRLFEAFDEETKDLSKQLYNGVQKESPDQIIALAGNPGMITIATNTAGRGADIVPTPQAEENGGVVEITTFPTINTRVEEQAFCRTGRQGRQGTCLYILNKTDLKPFFDKDKMPENDEEIIKAWRKERAKRGKQRSKEQRNEKHYMDLVFTIQTVFWQFLMCKPNCKELQKPWRKSFDTIYRVVRTAVRDKLFNDQDFQKIIHEVATQFLNFCEANKVISLIEPESGRNLMHFLAKNGMTRPIMLFAFHQPSLLLSVDQNEHLPLALAKKKRLQTVMKQLTDEAKKQCSV